ncbi:MAG TPA: response regulator [Candidatus Methylomirabilis sp.]|nr:response regulator [Candidatus Methylomirabilis sp.]
MKDEAGQQNINELASGSKPKILLLEDYPDLIAFYTHALDGAGFAVMTSDNEEEGEAVALQEKPDLVILDISLPTSDDFSFIRRLKERPETADLPVIVLTDLSGEEDIKRGMDAGADAYLVRDNFSINQIIDKIKEVINKSNK